LRTTNKQRSKSWAKSPDALARAQPAERSNHAAALLCENRRCLFVARQCCRKPAIAPEHNDCPARQLQRVAYSSLLVIAAIGSTFEWDKSQAFLLHSSP